MSGTDKLSVGKALDKLRGTEPKRAKITQLNEQIDSLDEETRRLRAQRLRIERDQKRGS